MSAKPKTTSQPARKSAAKKAAKKPWFKGKMGRSETTPLLLASLEAYNYQDALGNIPPGQKFDAWRREQVMAKVGRNGLSDCAHDHYRPLMGHFKILAGRDGEAFQDLITTGPASDNAAEGDDHESRRNLAHVILEILAEHMRLADISAQDLAAQTENTLEYQKLRARRAAIQAHPKGAFREGYIVRLARDITRKPDLNLGRDLKAGLADRCAVDHLTRIRDTLVNRIAVREDRPESEQGRNRKRRSAAEKARLDPGGLTPRFDLPDGDPF